MSDPKLPEHIARNKYQAAQIRLGTSDVSVPPGLDAAPRAPHNPFTSTEHPTGPGSAADLPLNLPPLPNIGTYSGPGVDNPVGRAAANPGFRPRYADPSPAKARQVSLRNSSFQESSASRYRMMSMGGWNLATGHADLAMTLGGAAVGLWLIRLLWNGVPNGRAVVLVVPLIFALGVAYRQWQKKQVARRRYEQVTRIRPAWTRHNAVSCRSLGVGIKRAGTVWLADDGTAKDLVLAWSKDGFEIYGGERSLTRVISIPWSDVAEIRTERAAVGAKKGQAGVAVVTRSNAVLTVALRPEPTAHRGFRSRTELAPIVTQLRQFVPTNP